MTMVLPRPSAFGTRPAYLDGIFRDYREQPSTPSAHSSASSISTNSTASNYDLRSAYNARPLSPRIEEEDSDTFSVRSKKSFLTRRRFGLGSILNRRTYPQVEETVLERRPSTSAGQPQFQPSRSPPLPPVSSPLASEARTNNGRPLLPKLQTNFPPPQAVATYANRPLPAVPGQKKPSPRTQSERPPSTTVASPRDIKCQPCYYFSSRNCNGYVIGGGLGDACETCLVCRYESICTRSLLTTYLERGFLRSNVIKTLHFPCVLRCDVLGRRGVGGTTWDRQAHAMTHKRWVAYTGVICVFESATICV